MPILPRLRILKSPFWLDDRPRFPSLKKWEAKYEPTPTLAQLRVNRTAIDVITKLADKEGLRSEERALRAGAITRLVADLSLQPRQADQLATDALIIAAWHDLPAREDLGFGMGHEIRVLAHASLSARLFYEDLAPSAIQAEELIGLLAPYAGLERDDQDLLRLTRMVASFIETAERVTALFPVGKGRKRQSRRNQTMVLLIEAVEEATGIRVGVSRGTKSAPPHFTRRSGCFVRDMLNLLGHRNEQALVTAFEELRRPYPRKNEPGTMVNSTA